MNYTLSKQISDKGHCPGHGTKLSRLKGCFPWSKKSKKPDARERFSRFFRVFFRKPDKYSRNCPLLWKIPADRNSFEIIKTLAIRRLRCMKARP